MTAKCRSGRVPVAVQSEASRSQRDRSGAQGMSYSRELFGDGPELLHEAHHVGKPPVFRDLSVLGAKDVYDFEFNRPVRCRHPHELPPMRSSHNSGSRGQIALRERHVDGCAHVCKRVANRLDEKPNPLFCRPFPHI